MARPTTFEAATLAEVLRRYHELLTTHREYLNRLNVFPVPDADTGTNLGLTVQAAVDAVPATGSMVQVCTAIRRGSLMGARGASGVILSQLLGAFAAHINDTSPVSAVDFADALGAASAAADAAVVHPVEGTILTVARDAAQAARVAADGASLAVVIAAARDAAAESLQLLLDAFLNVVAGTPLPIPPPPVDGEAPTSGDGETFPHYEVVVRLAVDEGVLDEFRRAWAALGNESTVVVAEEGWWLAHIHTEYPEAAMEVARAAGDIHDVQVTDLVAQVTEVQARRTEE